MYCFATGIFQNSFSMSKNRIKITFDHFKNDLKKLIHLTNSIFLTLVFFSLCNRRCICRRFISKISIFHDLCGCRDGNRPSMCCHQTTCIFLSHGIFPLSIRLCMYHYFSIFIYQNLALCPLRMCLRKCDCPLI